MLNFSAYRLITTVYCLVHVHVIKTTYTATTYTDYKWRFRIFRSHAQQVWMYFFTDPLCRIQSCTRRYWSSLIMLMKRWEQYVFSFRQKKRRRNALMPRLKNSCHLCSYMTSAAAVNIFSSLNMSFFRRWSKLYVNSWLWSFTRAKVQKLQSRVCGMEPPK